MDKTIIKEWRDACFNSASGYNAPTQRFKEQHPEEYKLFTAMYRKRTDIKSTIETMEDLGVPIYWFTLTFNEEKDKNENEETKLKRAQQFLYEIAPINLMVEEYGSEKERYHIHGFLVFKPGCGFEDFRKWHSRQQLIELKKKNIKARIRYLTNYSVKQVPRLRRSKMLCKLWNYKKSMNSIRNNFYSTYMEGFDKLVDNLILPF